MIRRIGRRILMGLDRYNARRASLYNNQRYSAFRDAIDFIDYEKVPGDILEFGVFTGKTLALLYHLSRNSHWKFTTRRVVGLNSFSGLSGLTEAHPRWNQESCSFNDERDHPTSPQGSKVTDGVVRDLFQYYGFEAPTLHKGLFSETLPALIPSLYPKIALAHIDCDLYKSTRDVLLHSSIAWQEGTILLFDDWFHYAGNPDRGEAAATAEFFAKNNTNWKLIHYRQYATFCNAFIIAAR